MIILGIDPDSKAHGVAIYENKKLVRLECFTLIQIMELIELGFNGKDVTVHIEDVCANNATFGKAFVKNQAALRKVSNSVGRCQQSQIELERLFEHHGIEVVKHKISKKWKKDKKEFEAVTGWKGRSNEDTRSAAYFGFLGINPMVI